jgi:hypothetical protein
MKSISDNSVLFFANDNRNNTISNWMKSQTLGWLPNSFFTLNWFNTSWAMRESHNHPLPA